MIACNQCSYTYEGVEYITCTGFCQYRILNEQRPHTCTHYETEEQRAKELTNENN
jgi:hypothetical protein